MPTISSTPRSAGTSTRSGRISSTPRGVGSSASRGGSLTDPKNLAKGQATKSQIDAAGRKNVGAGPAFTPLGAVLKVLNIPNQAIGRAIEDPSSVLSYDARDAYTDKKPTTIGNALEKRGALDFVPEGPARTVTKLVADIALDPTTYVSFGGGAAVRGASTAAEIAATRALDDVIRAGGRPTLAQIGKASASRSAERAATPKSFKVGVRVPFTRGKDVVLAESQAIPAALERVANKLSSKTVRDKVAQGFGTSRGVGPVVNTVYHDLRRAGGVEAQRLVGAAGDLERAITKTEKALGMKRGAGAEAITRHLDNPEAYPVPAGLEDLTDRARGMLDDINKAEREAGIDYREVEHYVPHVGASRADRRRIQDIYAKPTASTLDEPFFVKPRDAPNLDAFEAAGAKEGFRPEFNIAKLIERRGRASINARTKKALDDSIYDEFGTTLPDESPDAAFEQWLGLRTSGKYHSEDALPPEIATDLQRIHAQITPLVKDDDALEATRQGIGRITSRWKSLALLSPGYHIRNLYDDGFRAYMAGARNPLSYTQATRLLAARKGKAPLKAMKIGDETWSRDELLRRAEAHGVIDTGFVRSETHSSVEEVGMRGLQGPGRGPLTRSSQKVGEYRENVTRLGTWIDLLKRGDDPAAAARTVREYLFDYGEVGKFVEEARRFWIPFITFTSKAIPFTLREFARHPGRGANIGKVMTASNQAAGNEDLSLLPSGSQSAFGVPFPNGLARRIIGAPDDQTLMVNPERLFAMGSLNLLDPRISRLRQNILGGMVNPAIRAPIEIATGKSFYLGSDLPKLAAAPSFVNQLAGLGVPIPTYVPAGAPGGKRNFYTGKPIGGYSAYLDTLLRLMPQYGQASSLIPGGGNENAQISAARYFFGVPVSPFDRAKALYRVQRFGNP